MFTFVRPASDRHFRTIRHLSAAVIAVSLLTGAAAPAVFAASPSPAAFSMLRAQNVDWMSPETAESLNVGIDVMVPSWVPEPFSGVAPSVVASDGYYQLYWMITGGAPTFLYIEGTAGGSLPAGSPADLNKQLTVNASVQGWSAIQDTGIPAGGSTPIYDQVWWIANGVLYTVSSSNMAGLDSLSLANSLVVLQTPTPDVPTEVPYVPPTEPPYVPPTEVPYVPPVETEPEEEVAEEPVSSDPLPAEELTTAPTSEPVTEPPVDTATVSESRVVTETQTENTTSADVTESTGDTEITGAVDSTSGDASGGTGGQGPWSPGRYESGIPSDGTNGARPPVIGGDGTGGVFDTALPSIRFRP